jgi:predicted phage terminase large subunit-like protein
VKTRRQILHERVRATEALLTRQAERSLRAFVEQAWHILEPDTPFLTNWHINLICEYLEAVTEGEITRLVINLPPRYMKSLLVSVLWPTWEWLRAPQMRWLFASYSESLSTKHSLDRRVVLQSPWYRDRWGDRFHLTSDQNEKAEYRNDRRGIMTATSVGGSATGKGGNRIVVDDPHNPAQAESDRQRQQAIDFFLTTLSTRLDDKRKGAIVVIMQRLHTRDLTAVCLDQGYTSLIIPVEAEYPSILTFPRSGATITRAVGELLWPARESHDDLTRQKAALGSYAYAGQYQQRPSPRGGGLFKRSWWKYYAELPSDMQEHAQSWDLAFKGGGEHDFVVGLVAARRGADIYLIDRYKQHASFQETLAAMRQMSERYPEAHTILVEDNANGPAIIDTLNHEIGGIIAVTPEGGKYARASACEPQVEAGNVYLPSPTAPNGHSIPERAWVHDFVEQLAVFPQGDHDDDVDAFSQLLTRWKHPRMSSEMIQRILRMGHRDGPEPRRIF